MAKIRVIRMHDHATIQGISTPRPRKEILSDLDTPDIIEVVNSGAHGVLFNHDYNEDLTVHITKTGFEVVYQTGFDLNGDRKAPQVFEFENGKAHLKAPITEKLESD